MKKTLLTTVTSLLLAFGICAFSACEGVTVTPDGSGGMVVKPLNPNGGVTVTPNEDGGITVTPDGGNENSSSTNGNENQNNNNNNNPNENDKIEKTYYDKDELLYVLFAGNSFIEFSDAPEWFTKICEMNNASGYAEYTWKPGAKMPDQYESAFGASGYMYNVTKPDVIFMQDIYDASDALKLGEYIAKMNTVSPQTELKVFPADNEGTDGSAAAKKYNVELVDWRTAIQELRRSHGFNKRNLNYDDDCWHANELNGLVGGVLSYISVYGEVPDTAALWNAACEYKGRENNLVSDFLPGSTEEEKKAALGSIMQLCASMNGIDEVNVCWHEFSWIDSVSAKCERAGYQMGDCNHCDYVTEREIAPLGHTYENGECIRCQKPEIPRDEGDLSTSKFISTKIIDKWLTHAALTVQSDIVSTNSVSSLKGAFNAKDAEETYDSTQDPNGDGGKWTWTVVTLDLKAMNGGSKNVNGHVLSFDVRVENGDVTSSVMLLNSAEKRSTQVPFNQDENNKSASDSKGFTKKILKDGWVRITVDLSTTFAGYDMSEVDDLYIIFSNARGDYVNDTVFYLDNMTLTLK